MKWVSMLSIVLQYHDAAPTEWATDFPWVRLMNCADVSAMGKAVALDTAGMTWQAGSFSTW